MKRVSKVMAGFTAAVLLTACSSNRAVSSANTESAVSVKSDYTETADAESMEFNEESLEGLTYQVPSEWNKRNEQKYNETDYKCRSSKDKIEVRFIEGADADLNNLITSTEWHETFTMNNSEEVQVGGQNALHAEGTSVIYDTIIYDCNAQLYLIPVSDGTVSIEFLQDPNGTVDYMPVFQKVIDSVQVQ